jgi:hypothetical protein
VPSFKGDYDMLVTIKNATWKALSNMSFFINNVEQTIDGYVLSTESLCNEQNQMKPFVHFKLKGDS